MDSLFSEQNGVLTAPVAPINSAPLIWERSDEMPFHDLKHSGHVYQISIS